MLVPMLPYWPQTWVAGITQAVEQELGVAKSDAGQSRTRLLAESATSRSPRGSTVRLYGWASEQEVGANWATGAGHTPPPGLSFRAPWVKSGWPSTRSAE